MARLGRGGILLGDILAVWDSIKSATPHLEDEATVQVAGNPKATRRDLYFLAAATAFALVRRYDAFASVSPPPSVIMVTWDAAGNSVSFYLKYKTNILTAALDGASFSGLTLFRGPPETVYGAGWNYTGALTISPDFIKGLPTEVGRFVTSVPNGKATLTTPALVSVPAEAKWVGRPILTRNPTVSVNPDPTTPLGGAVNIPSPNPRPSGDYRSRGTLYEMVYAALTTPQGAGDKFVPPVDSNTKFTGG